MSSSAGTVVAVDEDGTVRRYRIVCIDTEPGRPATVEEQAETENVATRSPPLSWGVNRLYRPIAKPGRRRQLG